MNALTRGHDHMLHFRGNGATDLAQARAAIWAALDPQDEALIEAVARRLCDAWHSDVPGAKADDVVLDLTTHPAGRCYRWHGYIEQAVVSIGGLRETIARQDNDADSSATSEGSKP